MLITAIQPSDLVTHIYIYIYTYIYVLFHIVFCYGLSQDIGYISLCSIIGPCLSTYEILLFLKFKMICVFSNITFHVPFFLSEMRQFFFHKKLTVH